MYFFQFFLLISFTFFTAIVPLLIFTDIDGAFFGPTFPNLFFMTYEDIVPEPVAEQVIFDFILVRFLITSLQEYA